MDSEQLVCVLLSVFIIESSVFGMDSENLVCVLLSVWGGIGDSKISLSRTQLEAKFQRHRLSDSLLLSSFQLLRSND